MNKLFVLGLVLLTTGTGCATQIRRVTAQGWDEAGENTSGVYVAYWEGTCKQMLGCNAGDGFMQWCALQADNSLVCTPQESVNALLTTTPTK